MIQPFQWRSKAWWPHTVDLISLDNSSEDTHDDPEFAAAICRRLRREGFGGDRKIFPIRVAVVEVYADGTEKEVQP